MIWKTDLERKPFYKPVPEQTDQLWLQYDGQSHSPQCSPEVGTVIDIILTIAAGPMGINQIKSTANNGIYRQYEVEVEFFPWMKKNKYENDAANTSRCTQWEITNLILSAELRWYIGKNNGEQVYTNE